MFVINRELMGYTRYGAITCQILDEAGRVKPKTRKLSEEVLPHDGVPGLGGEGGLVRLCLNRPWACIDLGLLVVGCGPDPLQFTRGLRRLWGRFLVALDGQCAAFCAM